MDIWRKAKRNHCVWGQDVGKTGQKTVFKDVKISHVEEAWNSIIKIEISGLPRNSRSVNSRQSTGFRLSNNHPKGSKLCSLGQTWRNVTFYAPWFTVPTCSCLRLETHQARTVSKGFTYQLACWTLGSFTGNFQSRETTTSIMESATFQEIYSKWRVSYVPGRLGFQSWVYPQAHCAALGRSLCPRQLLSICTHDTAREGSP